ncbi:MAG: hypothetical protein A3E85_03680 [Gammaproteobacteria bacterium RIFCSPHIGHO2_12_FULL_45_12]|nr:MAG: hypothetical protein A3E85_03680 [Gammaproteobacteria bacterium RIFCSPHIGHO2_12_FULL_45_12]
MTTHRTLSINKIMSAAVFICAALITSLFVYHLSKKPVQANINAENGVLFSLPRELKPFSLINANGLTFSEKDFYQHWTLLFFGFTHCASICPTTLEMLNRAYGKLHDAHPNLQVVLISLDPERDKPAILAHYVQSFNPAFIGASGKRQDLRKLQSELGIYAMKDTNRTTVNYQLQHTPSILLINPQGKWVGLFNNRMKPSQFVTVVNHGIRLAESSSR